MRTSLEILNHKIGPDGRYYQLVKTQDGYAVISEGYSGKVNGRLRLFEAEMLTLDEATKFFTDCTAKQ